MILIEHLPFTTDRGIASRARIGLIVLATDYTIEHEWRAIIGKLPGVALYESRIRNDRQITPETLRAMEPRRIGVLTPYRADVNVIVADYIKARGFEVPVFGSYSEEQDNVVATITPASVKAGIKTIRDKAEIDAVFVSCTSLRLAEA